MNYDEIENHVKLAKQGNSESLTNLLIQFKPFIFKTAKNFNIKNYDEYDLVQIGYIALINAVEKYDISKHSFSSYVYSTIKNAMKYTARSNNKHKLILSINASIDGQSSLDFTEFLESNENLENDYLEHEKITQLQKALSDLEPDEFELIFFVYYNNFSLKDYATKKKISYSKIVRKKNYILDKLGSMLRQNIKN
ncbi:sigma-70 family RNA polymerase sigma factor [Clostridium beijerinckii]|uniref:sigma-70 family RNA polymerase sigma factor n=1 Tax=Clostridium beijerinckii TaxID=1520 RepID=UPI0012B17495|nr:sigma-70 family RNA polymerase sigma factor [Clostridium beijerinckii]MRY42901.1 sigma-70 family RNA polymerase sigma factor [Parabacteroides distasonis]MZK52042.1 sigma-70 family RNA polymerase sigma factor [Clostridium beijerinckii]MZK60183.1 sigma-70 family RNA polymerase sigma factor [Clostridium beijerinckii]MZK70468.1 sigma-70 family RNA polymerase sigma factor [Clostridium beijerinckii]MZK75770.1 sigma-70 family RNA polymerase sigma factor [Clostridium beijerinckii]